MHTVSGPDVDFAAVADRAAECEVRPEFEISTAPSPSRLAPHACALTAQAASGPADSSWESASGRFVLLHDPDGVDEWEGTFRAVIFARCDVESEMLADPLVHEVAWSWTTDALEPLHTAQIGGTVTVSTGTSFGTMSERRPDGLIEVRASWTPAPNDHGAELADDIGDHVRAWIDVLARLAGLPPLPPGVASVGSRRARAT